LQAVLRDGWAARVEGNTVVIGFDPKREFHKNKVSEDENRRMVEEALGQVLGLPCRVECELISPRSLGPIPAPSSSQSHPEQETTAGSSAVARESASADRYREVTQDPVIRTAVEELGAQIVDVNDG
jgi:hypothetical protein